MAAPAIVQQNTAASAVVSPATITPTLGVASTKGNLLIIALVLTGTATAFTLPAGGWANVAQTTPTGLLVNVMTLPNNPGGITNVAITITATGGGAVATIFEISNSGSGAVESSIASGGTGTSYGPFISGAINQQLADFAEMLMYAVGFAAATLTAANDPSWGAATGTGVSTNGVPNAQLANFFIFTSTQFTQPPIGGSFNASVVNGAVIVRFFVAQSFGIPRGASGGAIYVGAGGNPAGSLQVPQPQAEGNFFSGTTGSF